MHAKDVYIRLPCTMCATTVHAFRAHQGHIYVSLAAGVKIVMGHRIFLTELIKSLISHVKKFS